MIAVNVNSKIPSVFNQLKPGSTFLHIKGYKNRHDEISNFGIVFHISYKNCVKKSLQIWNNLSDGELTPVLRQARDELINSYSTSLTGYNPGYKNIASYINVKDANNNIIDGIKLNISSSELHLYGLVFNKVIIKPGVYKQVKSSELTQAKNTLKSLTPLSKFRQYRLVNGGFEQISVQKLTLTPNDLLI